MTSRLPVLASALLLVTLGAEAAPESIGVAVAARSIQPGELVVLTLTVPNGVDAVRVQAFGRSIQAFSLTLGTWRALIGIDLDVRPGRYAVSIEAEEAGVRRQRTYDLAVRPRRFPTRVLQVDEAFVNPPTSVRTRIAQEAAELDRLWTQSRSQRAWTGPFVRPVQDPSVSGFGARSIFNGQRRSPHGGADFLSAAGTPVAAPNSGRVALARDLYFSGQSVVIDHGAGLFSMLAHLSEITVLEGTNVSAGQVVGRVGATGRVTGPHLHWAVRVGGARIDPLGLLALLG